MKSVPSSMDLSKSPDGIYLADDCPNNIYVVTDGVWYCMTPKQYAVICKELTPKFNIEEIITLKNAGYSLDDIVRIRRDILV
jgi:hypothetical protein